MGFGLGAWEFSDLDEKALQLVGEDLGVWPGHPQGWGPLTVLSVPSPCGNSQHAPELPAHPPVLLKPTRPAGVGRCRIAASHQQIYSRGRGSPCRGWGTGQHWVGHCPSPHHPGLRGGQSSPCLGSPLGLGKDSALGPQHPLPGPDFLGPSRLQLDQPGLASAPGAPSCQRPQPQLLPGE